MSKELRKSDKTWNDRYERYSRLWGDDPSELALKAVLYLRDNTAETKSLNILDVACGYGRDTFYIHEKLGCRVTGVDISSKAILMAESSLSPLEKRYIQFLQGGFLELSVGTFDVLFVSKFFHLLDRSERSRFLEKVMAILKPNGLLFLSTHSIRDPQLYGKGVPHPSEPDTFYNDNTYCHFTSTREMHQYFQFLKIEQLYEYEYLEPRRDGKPHHHISWILIGEHRGGTIA